MENNVLGGQLGALRQAGQGGLNFGRTVTESGEGLDDLTGGRRTCHNARRRNDIDLAFQLEHQARRGLATNARDAREQVNIAGSD
jgi:hypothetical protein